RAPDIAKARFEAQVLAERQVPLETRLVPQPGHLGMERLAGGARAHAAPGHLPLVRRQEPRERAQQARLAAAVRPLDEQELAGRQREVEAAEQAALAAQQHEVAAREQRAHPAVTRGTIRHKVFTAAEAGP